MEYLRRVIFPYALLGAVASGVSYLYMHDFGTFSMSGWIQSAINKMLSFFGASASSGVGEFVSTVLNIFIQGALIGVAVYITNRFVPIPEPTSISDPITNLVAPAAY